MPERWQRRIVWVVRATLLGAVAISVAFPGWEQFDGKGMPMRAPLYLASMFVVPVAWRVAGRRPPYPHLVDALVVTPFALDTLGNVWGFYESFERTDDVLHLVNWVALFASVALALRRTGIGRLAAWAMCWGLGALAIIWWEVAEYLVQESGTTGLSLTYEDTLGDLVLSSSGAAIGAGAVVLFAWRSPGSAQPAGRDAAHDTKAALDGDVAERT